MKSERQWGFSRETFLDVRHGLFVVQAAGRAREPGEILDAFQKFLLEVTLEVHRDGSPVPVLDDVAAVHDLADDVLQIVPRNLRVVLQVVVHALTAAQQVTRVERVIHVPPDATRRVR